MSISTSSYFSNSMQGIPQVGGEIDLFSSSTTPKHAIGYRIQRQDGAEFVYSHFGAASVRGLLVSQDISESGAVDANMTVVAPASSQTTTDGTTGFKFVEITDAGVTAGDFAGGYFCPIDETGEGYTYRIKGNTTTGNPASGNYRLELYDPIQADVAADTQTVIVGSVYANLEPAVAAEVPCAGVTVVTQAAADYGWVQTKGVVSILGEGSAMAVGGKYTVSDGGTPGACQLSDTEVEYAIGYGLSIAADTEHAVVMLQLGS